MQRDTDDRRLLHALSLSVLATDEAGIIVFANDAATEMFARTTDELVGSQVVDIVALGPGEAPALPAVLPCCWSRSPTAVRPGTWRSWERRWRRWPWSG